MIITFDILNLIGGIGGFFLAISALPQVIQCVNNGHANGINAKMLWLWYVGVICMFVYTFKYKDALLTLNYLANCIFVGTILLYKYFPRKS